MTSERNTHPPGSAAEETCAAIRDRLPLFGGGDLEEPVLEEVRAHLADCPPCAEAAATAARARASFVAALSEPPADLANPDLWPDLRPRLVEEGLLAEPTRPTPRLRPVPSTWRRVGGIVAVAAAVLAVVLLTDPFGGGATDPAPVPGGGADSVVAETSPEEPAPSGLRRVSAEEEAVLNGLESTDQPSLPGRSHTGLAGYR